MQSDYQDIIISFIEETQENLNTIEQGLLNLQTVAEDFDVFSKVLRATHTIKGAAGMLDFASIRYIAHRMEDCFKQLQTHRLQVDQKLGDLLFKCLNTLQALTSELRRNCALPEPVAQQTLQEIEPVLQALDQHLATLTQTSARWPKASQSKASSPSPSRISRNRWVRGIVNLWHWICQIVRRWLP